MSFRIAVDTGGTFSDVVVTDDAGGELWVSKAPTTPDRVFIGIAEALTYGAQQHALDLGSLLGGTSVFIYGTTRATNATLTGATARTAFLTTEGHPDILLFREGGRTDVFNWTREMRTWAEDVPVEVIGGETQALPDKGGQAFQHLHHIRSGLALQDQAGDEELQVD